MNVVRRHRLEHGMTQAELGEKTGVSRNSVISWESGSCPRPKRLLVLAAVLGVMPRELLQELAERNKGV